MTRTLFTLSLGFAGLILATQAGYSAPQCGQRPQVLDHLGQQYGESRRGMGVAGNNTVMELFASASTGSWTIIVTMPDGMSCLVATGLGYESVAEELPAKGDPA